MTGYNPALAALASKTALDLLAQLLLIPGWSLKPPEKVGGMSRDALISELLPPKERKRIKRPYPREARWL